MFSLPRARVQSLVGKPRSYKTGSAQEKNRILKSGVEGAVFSELLECCLLGSESLTFPPNKITVLSDFLKGEGREEVFGLFTVLQHAPQQPFFFMFHGLFR